MHVSGRCLCGHVNFTAEIDPAKVIVCHCTDCQRNSSTAFGTVVGVVDERFTLKTGDLKTYVKTADSGTKRALKFCPECGTRVYAKTLGEGTQFMGLRVGTLDQRAELVPAAQAYTRSAAPWLGRLAEIPAYEGSLAGSPIFTGDAETE